MKRSIAILLCTVLVIPLSGCGGKAARGSGYLALQNAASSKAKTVEEAPVVPSGLTCSKEAFLFDLSSDVFSEFGETWYSRQTPVAYQELTGGSFYEFLTSCFHFGRVFRTASTDDPELRFDTLSIMLKYPSDDGDDEKAARNMDAFLSDMAMIEYKCAVPLVEQGYQTIQWNLVVGNAAKVTLYTDPRDWTLDLTRVQIPGGIYQEAARKRDIPVEEDSPADAETDQTSSAPAEGKIVASTELF